MLEIPNIISKFYIDIYAKKTLVFVLMRLTVIWDIFKWTLKENLYIFWATTDDITVILVLIVSSEFSSYFYKTYFSLFLLSDGGKKNCIASRTVYALYVQTNLPKDTST